MNDFSILKDKKTLLIDDDEMVRVSLRLVFTTNGCFIQTEESAEEGLRALEDENFDIFLSGLRLPGVDGLSFLNELL